LVNSLSLHLHTIFFHPTWFDVHSKTNLTLWIVHKYYTYQYPPRHSFLVWYKRIFVIIFFVGAFSGSPQQAHSMSHSPEKKSYRNVPFCDLYLDIRNSVNGSGIS
jgi:hypothetical protein